MADPFPFLDGRLRAILFEGRGADGALGAEAEARAIPAGHFRASFEWTPLAIASLPRERYDRALRAAWTSDGDDFARNELDADQLFAARLTVAHGVIYGEQLAGYLWPVGEPAEGLQQPQARASGDARRVLLALECTDLWRDGTETDPIPVGCVREGGTAYQELGEGKLYATSTFVLTYRATNP